MQTEVTAELTFEDLRMELARLRGEVPTRTLYDWIRKMRLMRNSVGYYTPDDLEMLKGWIRYKNNGGSSIEDYVSAIRQGV